jgi:LCP family protein required for cell wall assembly
LRHSVNWFLIFVIAALLGIIAGYFATLFYRPTLIPPAFRVGSLRDPETIMLLGVDVVYTELGRRKKKIDQTAFNGRSDTVMLCRLDPFRNSLSILSIPRDTEAQIPGNGMQKVNAANAIGGAELAKATVSQLMGIPVDHYVVLNVHGLVELVNELGGITVVVPKRMKYMDWTAKLKIDLEPGPHTLTGNQAMGFVRFRHDALGDIGRVQRQQLFMTAVMEKAIQPGSWAHLPRLIEIGQQYIATDLSPTDIMEIASFARAVPKKNQSFVMLPGEFAGNGDWVTTKTDVRRMSARLLGSSFVTSDRPNVRITLENQSSLPLLGPKLARMLRAKGYPVNVKQPDKQDAPTKKTRIIAQRANPEDAELVHGDLGDQGEIINASVGDLQSEITVIAGDDLEGLVSAANDAPVEQPTGRHKKHHRRSQ